MLICLRAFPAMPSIPCIYYERSPPKIRDEVVSIHEPKSQEEKVVIVYVEVVVGYF